MAEFDDLDEDLDPDPPWTTQYTVQEIPDLEYLPEEHIAPGKASAPEEASNMPISGEPDPTSSTLSNQGEVQTSQE